MCTAGALPDADKPTMRNASPPPRRRSTAPSEAFDLIEVASFLVSKFKHAHGDRTIGLAFLNPKLKTMWPEAPSPRDFWRVVEPLQDAELWNLFKDAGGISKEIEPHIDEGAQLEALKALWEILVARAK